MDTKLLECHKGRMLMFRKQLYRHNTTCRYNCRYRPVDSTHTGIAGISSRSLMEFTPHNLRKTQRYRVLTNSRKKSTFPLKTQK